MRRDALSVAVLGLATVLALAGLAAAEDGDPAVAVPGPSVGDQLAYREHVDTPAGSSTYRTTVEVGPEEPGLDRFGDPAAAHAVQVQRRDGQRLVAAETCRADASGEPGALRTPLTGGEGAGSLVRVAWETATETDPWRPGWLDAGPPAWQDASPALAHGDRACLFQAALPAPEVAPGDRLRIEALWPSAPEGLVPEGALTEAATSTTLDGRPAVELAFSTTLAVPQRDGAPLTVPAEGTATIAEGLPAPAELEVRLGASDASSVRWTRSLAGYAPGDGPTLERGEVGQAPAGPSATTPLNWTGPAGLGEGFPYPLADAIDAVASDPTLGFSSFMEQHSDAYLTRAVYDRDRQPAPGASFQGVDPGALVTEGGWRLTFSEGAEHYTVETVRLKEPHQGPDTACPRVHWNAEEDGSPGSGRALPVEALPDAVAAPEAVAGGFAAGGFEDLDVPRFVYHVRGADEHHLPVVRYRAVNATPAGGDLAGDDRARDAFVDGRTGGLLGARTLGGDAPEPAAPTTTAALPATTQAADAPLDALAAWGAGLVAALLALPLLYRYVLSPLVAQHAREELLEHEARARLLEAVREDPGVHQAELFRRSELGQGATLHHLRKLVDAGLLERFEDGGYRRYFPAGDVARDAKQAISALRSGCNREVYERLQEDPSRSVREVARALDRSPSTVHRALRQLREAGLVEDG